MKMRREWGSATVPSWRTWGMKTGKQNREINQNTAKRGSLRIEQLGTLMKSSPGCLLSDRGWVVGMEPESRWPSSPHRCGILVVWQGKPERQGGLKMRTRPLHLHHWLSLPMAAVFFFFSFFSLRLTLRERAAKIDQARVPMGFWRLTFFHSL